MRFTTLVNLRNKRAGYDVVVYFDGLGSRVPIADSPYKGLRPAYEVAQREGVIYGVLRLLRITTPPQH